MHDLLFCSCFCGKLSPIKSVVLFLYIFLVVDENVGAHIAVVVFSLVVFHGA